MPPPGEMDVTQTLVEATTGDAGAAARLMPLVYDRLRHLAAHYMRREAVDPALRPTDLVHEAYLRLVDQTRAEWKHQTHFFAVAAGVMRRVLVDHARGRDAQKRGRGWQRVTLDEAVAVTSAPDVDLLVLNEALARLAELDSRAAQIIELRFFGGLGNAEVAEFLRVSLRTVEDDWRMARAWLRRELSRA
ncbi:MAG: ECF-type sigma factor [Planctomycetota bacterium]